MRQDNLRNQRSTLLLVCLLMALLLLAGAWPKTVEAQGPIFVQQWPPPGSSSVEQTQLAGQDPLFQAEFQLSQQIREAHLTHQRNISEIAWQRQQDQFTQSQIQQQIRFNQFLQEPAVTAWQSKPPLDMYPRPQSYEYFGMPPVFEYLGMPSVPSQFDVQLGIPHQKADIYLIRTDGGINTMDTTGGFLTSGPDPIKAIEVRMPQSAGIFSFWKMSTQDDITQFARMTHDQILQGIHEGINEGYNAFEVRFVQNIDTLGYADPIKQREVKRYGAGFDLALVDVKTLLIENGLSTYLLPAVISNGGELLAHNDYILAPYSDDFKIMDGRGDIAATRSFIERMQDVVPHTNRGWISNSRGDWVGPFSNWGGPFVNPFLPFGENFGSTANNYEARRLVEDTKIGYAWVESKEVYKHPWIHGIINWGERPLVGSNTHGRMLLQPDENFNIQINGQEYQMTGRDYILGDIRGNFNTPSSLDLLSTFGQSTGNTQFGISTPHEPLIIEGQYYGMNGGPIVNPDLLVGLGDVNIPMGAGAFDGSQTIQFTNPSYNPANPYVPPLGIEATDPSLLSPIPDVTIPNPTIPTSPPIINPLPIQPIQPIIEPPPVYQQPPPVYIPPPPFH